MAYNTPLTAVAGATFTAAQWNTSARDNMQAIWVGTTAGDIDYYTSSSAKARLAIGNPYQFQQVNAAGAAPVWGGLQKCILYKTANQTYNSGALANITWDTETEDLETWHSTSANTDRITVTANGWYVPFMKLTFIRGGGSGAFHMTSIVQLNGSDTTNKGTWYESIDANTKQFMYGGIPVYATAGQYFTANFVQDSGGSGTLYGGGADRSSFALIRIP